jgi:cytochrome d ubiquinol oxidase subunit I
VVYGVMRTADAVSPVRAGSVSTSLIMFLAVYAVVFAAGLLYILRLVAEGPAVAQITDAPDLTSAPGTPMAAATEGGGDA